MLVSFVDAWRKTPRAETRERAVSALAEFLYTGMPRFRLEHLTEDIRSDFIVWLYPRFTHIIEQFAPERAQFGTYIRSVVRLSYRTFLRNQYASEACQRVYEIEAQSGALEAESGSNSDEQEPAYGRQRIRVRSPKREEIMRRTVLLLACKAGNELGDDDIERAARLSGCTEDYLRSRIDLVRHECREKQDALRCSTEKRNMFYVRSLRCRYEMRYLDPVSARYRDLEKEYRYCARRLTEIRRRSQRCIRTPSNRLLAKILGISRGTIDSTLASALHSGYAGVP